MPSHTSRFYINLHRLIRKYTDPLVKKRKMWVNAAKGKASFIQGLKDFAKGLKKL